MLTLLLKAKPSDEAQQIPLKEKLLLIFRDRVKSAKSDEDREREQRRLDKLESTAGSKD